MRVPVDMLQRIWNLPGDHIPWIHAEWWEDAMPNNFRAMAMIPDAPVAVTERREVPAAMAAKSPFGQLLMAGEALAYACFDPILRYSLAGQRLVYAAGVTVLLVEARRGGELIAVPWSYGEDRRAVVKRLVACRKWPSARLNPVESYVASCILPRCQAAVSVVGHLGIANPGTNILASGGECPISVTIGAESIHFVLDHRIYDPEAAAVLYARFFNRVNVIETKEACA